MLRGFFLLLLAVPAVAFAKPDRRTGSLQPAGILVLDNCDDQYQGKEKYADNFSLLSVDGKQQFRDGATGNVWALQSDQIGKGKTVVYDQRGKEVASYNVTGWDIVYDAKAKAFWMADGNLTKVNATNGEVLLSIPISTWCASSLDIDPRTGAVWVAVRQHGQVAGSSNRLLKFDSKGMEIVAVELGAKMPFRVSVDSKSGSVWIAHMRKSVERFSEEGKSLGQYPLPAIAVQVESASGDAWVVTETDVQRINSAGETTRRLAHAGRTSQAWIASLE